MAAYHWGWLIKSLRVDWLYTGISSGPFTRFEYGRTLHLGVRLISDDWRKTWRSTWRRRCSSMSSKSTILRLNTNSTDSSDQLLTFSTLRWPTEVDRPWPMSSLSKLTTHPIVHCSADRSAKLRLLFSDEWNQVQRLHRGNFSVEIRAAFVKGWVGSKFDLPTRNGRSSHRKSEIQVGGLLLRK